MRVVQGTLARIANNNNNKISYNTVSIGYDQSQPGTNPESHPESSSERPRKLAWISARLTANCMEKLGKSIYPIECITKTAGYKGNQRL